MVHDGGFLESAGGRMGFAAEELARFVEASLSALADADKAAAMAAYMKTVPEAFYGVQKPERLPTLREVRRRFVPPDARAWRAGVRAVWDLERREARYLAIEWAATKAFARRFLVPEAVALLEALLREGAWWDTVDGIANQLVSPLVLSHREALRPTLERWIDDADSLWVRRAAILSQLHHRGRTDAAMLFDFCLRRAHEREFFVRKAIGWALREYSSSAPEAVLDFVREHGAELSGLSVREATKRLRAQGYAV